MTRPLALVTGATSGIGEATARALVQAGYDVVVAARREDRLRALSKELSPHATPILLDVRDDASLARAMHEHGPLLSRVDLLVNNAGLALGTDPVHEGDPAEWDVVIDTNVKGLLRVTRAILPHMVARKRGHVVNLGSTAGRWVYPGGAVYCATKFAVRALTEGLRMDLNGTNVRVTTIDPGMVATEFSEVRFRGDKDRARKTYEGFEPLRAEDIADTVVWCAMRPPRVNIQEVVIYPTAQASIRMVHKESG